MQKRPSAQAAFGHAVRELRHARDVSQEELAMAIGVHRTYLSLLERGRCNATLGNILRIAAALDMTGAELLSRAGL